MSSFQNSIHMVAGKYPSPDLTHLVIVLSHPVNEVITVITETVAAATETLSETSDPDSPGGDEIQFVSSEEEGSLLAGRQLELSLGLKLGTQCRLSGSNT